MTEQMRRLLKELASTRHRIVGAGHGIECYALIKIAAQQEGLMSKKTERVTDILQTRADAWIEADRLVKDALDQLEKSLR